MKHVVPSAAASSAPKSPAAAAASLIPMVMVSMIGAGVEGICRSLSVECQLVQR